MECAGARYIIHPSRSDEFRIWNLSDLHLLSASCAEGELRRDIARIRDDPRSFWLGGGDYADYIGYDDAKRFDPDCVTERLTIKDLGQLGKKSAETSRDWMAPIKDKCLGLLLGNHEKQYQKRHQQEDLHAWLCTELGVVNLGYSALFDIVFCRRKIRAPRLLTAPPPLNIGSRSRAKFRIFAHHGAGYAQTPGGKLNKLIQFMHYFDADIYFIGHVHDKVGRRQVSVGGDKTCSTLIQRTKLGVISGSYLKTYEQGTTSYGEQRGYQPVSLGAAWAGIHPETRRIWGEI